MNLKYKKILNLALSSLDIREKIILLSDIWNDINEIKLFKYSKVDEVASHIAYILKSSDLIYSSVWDEEYLKIEQHVIILMDVLDNVGPMRDDFFIDLVDTEWCLRARKKGYEIVAINKVMIDHYLGDYAVNIIWHKYPIHSPIRMYYYFRNAIFLYSMIENFTFV